MKYELKPTGIQQAVLAVDYLSEVSGLSKTVIKDAMKKGAVWLTDHHGTRRLRRAKASLVPGQKIAFYYDEGILKTVAPQPTLIEDARDFSVWIKPAGVTSGGTRFGDHCAIDRMIEKNLDRACFLVHRLDRFAWGLMAIAHNKQRAAELSRQFQDRLVNKRYEAIVMGEVSQAVTIEAEVDGKPARSRVTPIEGNDRYTRVEVHIETGRKHQIRVHLSGIGHPILGDRQYGVSTENIQAGSTSQMPGLQLAAVELSFTAPAEKVWRQNMHWLLPDEQRPQLPG